MSVKKYTIEEIKTIVEPIARKYGVERVYLFGSYARDDITENSDVDLRVDKGSLKGMFALCGLYTEIEGALQMKVPEYLGPKSRPCVMWLRTAMVKLTMRACGKPLQAIFLN